MMMHSGHLRDDRDPIVSKGNAAFPSSTYLSSFWPLLQLFCDSFHKNISGGDKTPPGKDRREGWTDACSAVGFCLGSGLFGSYNSD